MKKIIILFLVIFIYANEISENKTFIQNVKSSTLSTTLKVHIQNKNISTIANEISNVLNIVNSYNFCKNNKYSILPKYKNQKFITYYTDLSFKCEFSKKKLPIFSELLGKIKNNIISIYDFEYKIPSKLYKQTQTILKIKAFNYGLDKAKKLSNTFYKKCFMKSLNFNQPIYTKNLRVFSESAISLPTPKNEGKNVILSVNYRFICF